MDKKLKQIKRDIEHETISLSDIFYLENNKKKILETNNMLLCQWAGITEKEYSNGKLEE